MKSRRHRAIDKSEKEITMCAFFHKKKSDKKWIKKEFKLSSRIYYDEMSELSIDKRI